MHSTVNSGGPLDNQTWQTEWKTAPLAKVQLCEYENQTVEAFVVASHSVCQVWLSSSPPEFTLLATVYDSETGSCAAAEDSNGSSPESSYIP